MADTTTAAARWIREELSTAADRCAYCGLGFATSDLDGVFSRWWDSLGRGPFHHSCAREMTRPADKRMQFGERVANDSTETG